MLLSDLQPGQKGVIIKILGHSAFRKRVMEMGFVKGRIVNVVLNAPLHDPIKYSIMGYEVSLRRAEADLIEVAVEGKPGKDTISDVHDVAIDHPQEHRDHHGEKVINVALLGNPNCGKTSLFNMVSGAHEHVGNYAGVTVGAKEGSVRYKGYRINIVDLPGTYSLSVYSPEEQYVVRYLREETPDVIVNVVVASNLERNLFLTTELIDMNRSMVIALNMFDELKKENIRLDTDLLGKMLGVPIVPTVASTGMGVHELLNKVIETFEDRAKEVRHIHVRMRPEVEEGVSTLNKVFKQVPEISGHFSPRFLAIKFLEHDPEIEGILKKYPQYPEWRELRDREEKRIEGQLGDDMQAIVSAEKYGFIDGALAETMDRRNTNKNKATDIIDAFVTNKLFGFPIFLLVMWLMFWATFQVGAYPMEWIEQLVAWISGLVSEHMPDGPFKDLLLDGVIGGVGSVIVFLPNILILYAFISFMEDSGYMARVAFIMDKLMHSDGDGLRLQRPGHHVHAYHREQVLAPDHHTDNPLHELFGAHPDLRAVGRLLLRRQRLGVRLPIRIRYRRGGHHGPPAAPLLVPRRRNPVRHGAAPLPHPDGQGHHARHVDQGQPVPQEDGRTHPHRLGHHLGPQLLPPCRRTAGARPVRRRMSPGAPLL